MVGNVDICGNTSVIYFIIPFNVRVSSKHAVFITGIIKAIPHTKMSSYGFVFSINIDIDTTMSCTNQSGNIMNAQCHSGDVGRFNTHTHTHAQIKTHLHVCTHMRESTPTHLHTNTNRGIYEFINIFSPQRIIFCRNLSQCQFLLRYDVGISHKPQQQFHNGCRLFIKGAFQDC